MQFTLSDAIAALIYILPAYIANASPVIFGGGTPLDFGKNFIDGRRIFGDNKTIRGLVAGIALGTVSGVLVYLLAKGLPEYVPQISLENALLLALLLSIGTHIGDLFGSFIKRRLNLKPGEPAPVLDQIGFLVFAILIAYPYYPFPLGWIIFLLGVTLVVHPLSNAVAYILKLKEHPW